MFWTAYWDPSGQRRVGVLADDKINALDAGIDFVDMLRGPRDLTDWARQALTAPADVVAVGDVRRAAIVHTPPSIRDFMAFEEHVVTSNAALGLELDPDWYNIPVFYFTNPAAVREPETPIGIAPGSSKFDFELEFAVVIGKQGSDISVEDAESHVAGFTLLCDWSARDLQEREMRLTLGPAKGKDTATSLGPVLVTPDELEPLRRGHSYDIDVSASVNGRVYSSANLATMYWSFAEMIAFASRGTELRPGDVIGSGTVGTGCILELSRVHGTEAFPYLQIGDEVHIDGGVLGQIVATIERGREPQPLRDRR